METLDFGVLFMNAVGVSYRLFIHSCPEKEEISNLIEVSKRSPELDWSVQPGILYKFE